MSIFSRSRTPDEADQARAALATEVEAPGGQPEPHANAMPGFMPGVVPPPAAPIYSMRPPEPATRVHDDAATAVVDRLRTAREALDRAQVNVEGRVRVDAQRRRAAAAPDASVRRRAPAPRAAAMPMRPRHAFDPVAATQAGLLNLAWRWQQAGSPIRAIHAYLQILQRYPGSPGADAAVADLVELSSKLAGTGQFHIALGIYDRLEELLAGEPC